MTTTTPEDHATIRLYYYSTSNCALKTLWERRLKIARYAELNDPFESFPFQRPADRRAGSWWESMAARVIEGDHGVLCFSETWQDPQMWSVYGSRYTGMCLGFDVLRDRARPVVYVDRPIPTPDLDGRGRQGLALDVIEAAYLHKNAAWKHEREWRVRAPLGTAEAGIHYFPLDQGVELREVILGPRCALRPADILHAVASPPMDVEIFAAQVSGQSFLIGRHELLDTHNVPGFRSILKQTPDAMWQLGDPDLGID